MGNRAVITTKPELTEVGMYLHWNGGRASVEAFLAYCKTLSILARVFMEYKVKYGKYKAFQVERIATRTDILSGIYGRWDVVGRRVHGPVLIRIPEWNNG